MKKIFILGVYILLILLVPNSFVLAHPGRTDASGCHTCRTNCPNWGLSTGEYHCHNAKAIPQPEEPIKSTYGEDGTGYTTPAPEYKNTVNTVSTIKNLESKYGDVKLKSQPVKNIVPEKTEEKTSWFIRFLSWFI